MVGLVVAVEVVERQGQRVRVDRVGQALVDPDQRPLALGDHGGQQRRHGRVEEDLLINGRPHPAEARGGRRERLRRAADQGPSHVRRTAHERPGGVERQAHPIRGDPHPNALAGGSC